MRWCRSWLLLLVLLASTGSIEAEISSSQGLSVELSAPTQRVLKQLSDGAVQWQKAFLQEDRTSAEAEQRNLLDLADSIGFERLPDLNNAALARAVEAAEQGDFPRARWALEAADAFDPGRPGNSFAAARIHRLQGEYIAAVTDSLRGYARLFALPVDLDLWQANLVLWLFYSFIGAGGFFVLLLMGTRGREVALDLADSLGQRVPRPL
ncbi:MAG: hypothetical protein SX243_20310, partial [Acidobacteriota bacterium]|nr:hypothetical protein [Acidobacteriota bacterium]